LRGFTPARVVDCCGVVDCVQVGAISRFILGVKTIRILLIEDDMEIARRLSEGLNDMGFVVEHAADGEMGLSLGRTEDFDAVILDLGLPDISGVEVLKKWRASDRKMPVLILTARDSWTEKVDGLNAGADDYITKPFHVPEVAARLRALIRRAAGAATPTLRFGEVEVAPSSGTVTLSGKPVDLTASEFRLLNYFMHRQGRVIPQTELLDHLYSLDEERDPNTIEVYVARLRKKLGRDIIKTLRGLGYRMG
jgi:two-component system OmpR family response regulator